MKSQKTGVRALADTVLGGEQSQYASVMASVYDKTGFRAQGSQRTPRPKKL